MMKKRRILSLILAAMLLSGVMSSCAEDTAEQGESSTTSNTQTPAAADTTAEETEDIFEKDNLPDTLDYNEETVTAMVWHSFDKSEFFVEEDTGEIVDSAVFNRNLVVEERLNVKLNWLEIPHDWATWKSNLTKSVTAGDMAYDIVANYGMQVAQAAIKSELLNLAEVPHIELDRSWYYKSATQAGTFGEHVYTVAGDLSYSALGRMSGVFFNTQLLTNKNLPDPYELVLANEWTLDKFGEILTDSWEDLDGNGEKDYATDLFGLVVAHDQMQTTYYSGGLVWVDHDEDNLPKVSDDVNGEQVTTQIDKWISIMEDSTLYGNVDDTLIFDEGRACFYIYPLGHVSEGSLRDSDITYGFVPQPKYDDQQENYIAPVTNAVTLWAIPKVVASVERSGALMECLASEGYRQVTPVVFEQAYGSKYNSDESGRQTTIFNMMRANVHFDLGKIFSDSLFQGLPNSAYANCIVNKSNNYTSQMRSFQRAIGRGLEKTLKDMGYERD